MRFFRPPFRLVEPVGHEAAMIVDANGMSVAMMLWPAHAPEDEEAAVQETYAVGRLLTASGIEAATADETRSGSAEGESPAPVGGDAQKEVKQ